VRFWLQSVSRLTSAVWEGAARQALQPLLQVTLEVFDLVVQQRYVCVVGVGGGQSFAFMLIPQNQGRGAYCSLHRTHIGTSRGP
jgi:hypothetical protein